MFLITAGGMILKNDRAASQCYVIGPTGYAAAATARTLEPIDIVLG
jgi:hypothetical protein